MNKTTEIIKNIINENPTATKQAIDSVLKQKIKDKFKENIAKK